MSSRSSIFDPTRGELAATLQRWGEQRFRADQVFDWLYRRLVVDPSQMTNLPLGFRQRLGREFEFSLPEIDAVARSADGSAKYRLALFDGERIECVAMPEDSASGGNGALSMCLSTQVGCPLYCAFCRTGTMGLRRQLAAGEILAQAVLLLKEAAFRPAHVNIMMMGMGEPLLNLEAVLPALETLSDGKGLNIPPRRVVVSTAGIPAGIAALAALRRPPRLALSLNAPTQELREKLMPIARQFRLSEILDACRAYPTGRRPMTVEYVMLRGINSGAEHAESLAALVTGLEAVVNLIPYNESEGLGFAAPGEREVQRFLSALSGRGIRCTVRRSRGRDVGAACGQLAAE